MGFKLFTKFKTRKITHFLDILYTPLLSKVLNPEFNL